MIADTRDLPQDLSQLGRPIGDCIIIDNSPASYVFHPNNAVPISSWFNDPCVNLSYSPSRFTDGNSLRAATTRSLPTSSPSCPT